MVAASRFTGKQYRLDASTTTNDVVRDIVLPETAKRRCCYVIRLDFKYVSGIEFRLAQRAFES